MKSIKNIIINAAVIATAGFGLSSCDIDMLPLNEVVLENFWTDKTDVESVVTSCYAAVQDTKYIDNLIVWGETRSDNVAEGAQVTEALKYLMKGSIKTKSEYCDWSSMYTVINRCNTVLEYAPIVAEKDPNYTESDMKINIAECKFLRAMTYLYLIKTFKDVPFTLEASIDDTQEYRLKQTGFNEILEALIKDIEGCKDFAPRRYSEYVKNTGRITRAAMYSLLAELYLWRASDYNLSAAEQDVYYKKCVEACDYVINYKYRQYTDNDFENIDIRRLIDKEVYNEHGYPLLAEEMTVGQNSGGPQAFNSIFGQGGSFETIFEIKFNAGAHKATNTAVNRMYGLSSRDARVVGHEKLMESKPENNSAVYSSQKLFSVPSDYRMIASFYYKEDATDYNIYKYVVDKNLAGDKTEHFGSVGSVFTPATNNQSYRNDNCPNWIIYRLTEIMLFRAEAEIELAYHMDASAPEEDDTATEGTGSKRRKAAYFALGSSLSTADELKEDAFNLISAVYRRSNPEVKTKPNFAPKYGDVSATVESFRSLLMDERRREFLFEGKRYYDLVRISRRVGNTDLFRKALQTKYGEAGQSVAIKMLNMNFMYMPVSYNEMIVNPNLVQNECYLDELENIKN